MVAVHYSNPRIGSSRRHSQTVAPKSNVPPNSTVTLPVMTSRDPTTQKFQAKDILLCYTDSIVYIEIKRLDADAETIEVQCYDIVR